MSDETYGYHLDQLFENLRTGKIVEKQKAGIVASTPEDVAKILTNERIRLLQVIRKKYRIYQQACPHPEPQLVQRLKQYKVS